MNHVAFRTAILATCLVFQAHGGTEATASAPSAKIRLGEPFFVEQGTGEQLRQFPFALGVRSRGAGPNTNQQVFVSFSENLDSGKAEARAGARVSRDGGKTFPEYMNGVTFTSSYHRPDGTIVTVNFRTRLKAESSGKAFSIDTFASEDEGKTWTHHEGELESPEPAKSMYFHRGILAAKDGSLLVPLYGTYESDKMTRAVLARSTDGGRNWKIISTIATATPALLATAGSRKPGGPNETTVERCGDGSLLAVFRTAGGYPLHQCRSTDEGLTWTEPVKLPGLTEEQLPGVSPHVVRIANGALVLAYGRPGMHIAVSLDGNGARWSHHTKVFNGEKTSGYPALVEVSPNKLLLFGDTGANWQYTMKPFPSPNPFSIWARTIEVERQ